MNDYDKAVKNIGNRFDFVLVASERLRELRREQKRLHDAGFIDSKNLSKELLHQQAVTDIENGKVGLEYLDRVKDRTIKRGKIA